MVAEATRETDREPLPLGTRAQHGQQGWYLVHCPEGRERPLARELAAALPHDVLVDAFVPCQRRDVEEDGHWRRVVEPVFPGYLVAVAPDGDTLARELSRHSYPVTLAGKMSDGYAPLSAEAERWLSAAMDEGKVMRIASGGTRGPRAAPGGGAHNDRRLGSGPEPQRAGAVEEDVARSETCTLADGTSLRIGPTRVRPSLPLGRRSPRGRLRWYLAHCPAGREEELCQDALDAIPADVLEDAFVPKTEVLRKVRGQWLRPVKDLFDSFFVVATSDAAALTLRLRALGTPVRLAGTSSSSYSPIDDAAWGFFSSCLDDSHTIRTSEGEIVGDALVVHVGPLTGHEARVRSYERRHGTAVVEMGSDTAGTHVIVMPLAILGRR